MNNLTLEQNYSDKTVYSLFGIEVFFWEDWDNSTDRDIMYFGVVWPQPSMSEYNPSSVLLTADGRVDVFIPNCDEPFFSGWIIDIPEFREQIMIER